MSTIRSVRLPHGRTLRNIWLVLVLLYAAGRAVAADALLGEYGVRGEVYFFIEILSAIPFARFSGYLVEDISEGRSWFRNGLITVATHIPPDIYLLVALHSAPSHIYAIAFVVMLILAAISIYALRRRAIGVGASREAISSGDRI